MRSSCKFILILIRAQGYVHAEMAVHIHVKWRNKWNKMVTTHKSIKQTHKSIKQTDQFTTRETSFSTYCWTDIPTSVVMWGEHWATRQTTICTGWEPPLVPRNQSFSTKWLGAPILKGHAPYTCLLSSPLISFFFSFPSHSKSQHKCRISTASVLISFKLSHNFTWITTYRAHNRIYNHKFIRNIWTIAHNIRKQ
jgi:hypothetical protein